MTKEELLAKIATIKNATQKGENTAIRVGGAMEDSLNFTTEQLNQINQSVQLNAEQIDELKRLSSENKLPFEVLVFNIDTNKFANVEDISEIALSKSDIEEMVGMPYSDLENLLATSSKPIFAVMAIRSNNDEENNSVVITGGSTFQTLSTNGKLYVAVCTLNMGGNASFTCQILGEEAGAEFGEHGMITFYEEPQFHIEDVTSTTGGDDATPFFDCKGEMGVYTATYNPNITFKSIKVYLDTNSIFKLKTTLTTENPTLTIYRANEEGTRSTALKTINGEGTYNVEIINSNGSYIISATKEV